MKRIFKPAIQSLLGIFILVANIGYSQVPTTSTTTTTPTTIQSTSNTGGSGGILEPPGGGVLDGVYTPEHLVFRKPIPYVYEREADIMWQRRIWRVIDLREKINHPLYYPDDTASKRPALFWVIKKGIAEGKINAVFNFDPFTNEFGPLMPKEEMLKQMTEEIAMKDSIGQPLSDAAGNPVVNRIAFGTDRIAQYWLKEEWFFEKQRSVMDVRIISICPIIESEDPVQGKFSYKPLFWIYYPAIRDILAKAYCYNPYNDAEWRTYDEIFHKRLFNSYTRMESNVYNRPIVSYLAGQSMEQLLESERVKDDIFRIEHDMWNY
jgi:gliding motility associated protien GldN